MRICTKLYKVQFTEMVIMIQRCLILTANLPTALQRFWNSEATNEYAFCEVLQKTSGYKASFPLPTWFTRYLVKGKSNHIWKCHWCCVEAGFSYSANVHRHCSVYWYSSFIHVLPWCPEQKKKKMVPSRIELLILALLAPRLNQLGQGTFSWNSRNSLLVWPCQIFGHTIFLCFDGFTLHWWALLVHFPFSNLWCGLLSIEK